MKKRIVIVFLLSLLLLSCHVSGDYTVETVQITYPKNQTLYIVKNTDGNKVVTFDDSWNYSTQGSQHIFTKSNFLFTTEWTYGD